MLLVLFAANIMAYDFALGTSDNLENNDKPLHLPHPAESSAWKDYADEGSQHDARSSWHSDIQALPKFRLTKLE